MTHAFEQVPGSEIFPAGAVLEKVATGATWSEGPLWLPHEHVLRWSDIHNNRILEFDPATGTSRTYREDVEFTNGRTLDRAGHVIQCSHGRRCIEMEVAGELTTLVDRWGTARLNSPNDVVVKSDGTIWFTDPDYGITMPLEGHPGEHEYGDHYVFRFDPKTEDLTPVVIDVEQPNGLAFSPDEQLLYVTDTAAVETSKRRDIRVYEVLQGRLCKNGRTFTTIDAGVSDGIRVDESGRVWSSSRDSIQVFDTSGERVARVPVPEVVANLCFGGDDGRDVYITASTSLYRIRSRTRGAVSKP
jgi:gluconolactonase